MLQTDTYTYMQNKASVYTHICYIEQNNLPTPKALSSVNKHKEGTVCILQLSSGLAL